jgi:hypothetical protein
VSGNLMHLRLRVRGFEYAANAQAVSAGRICSNCARCDVDAHKRRVCEDTRQPVAGRSTCNRFKGSHRFDRSGEEE